MGAAEFETWSLGKTVQEAFTRARDDALYWYGHGGYTGTIAEKDGYVLVGKLTSQQAGHLDRYLRFYEQWDQRTDGRKGRAPKGIPASVLPMIQRAYQHWNDKWGPAVAFEVTGSMVSSFKLRSGKKGSHDKLFLFCGLASE